MDEPTTQKPPRGKRRWVWWTLLFLLVLVALDYLLYPLLAPMGGVSGNTGENGVWVRYKWYFGEYQPTDMDRLVGRLRDGQFRYAYCHVRNIQPDGTLKYRKAESGRKLVDELHRRLPGMKVFAWVYVGTDLGTLPVNMGDIQVRKQALAEARWLVETCGFDGIQWDYEICRSGDPWYPVLLRESRAILPAGTLLGACTAMWYPQPVPRRYCWDLEYFAAIAKECDQVAVMGYDSAMYLPRAYVGHMRQQTARVTQTVAAANPQCRVLIGIPTYEAGSRSHHARAENLRLALKGVREGLLDVKTNRATFAGVSLFAEYTTDEGEWTAYRKDWLAE